MLHNFTLDLFSYQNTNLTYKIQTPKIIIIDVYLMHKMQIKTILAISIY